MMTVAMEVMNWAVFIHVLLISSGAIMADVSQAIGHAMVTMTVETLVMKQKQTAPRKVAIFFFLYFITGKYRECIIIHSKD